MANLINFFSNTLPSTKPTVQVQTPTAIKPSSSNPFSNPFVNSGERSIYTYAQNKPVKGGFFAGYHNGQPNIVGQRLFIEV